MPTDNDKLNFEDNDLNAFDQDEAIVEIDEEDMFDEYDSADDGDLDFEPDYE
jgi:hypothetical protein